MADEPCDGCGQGDCEDLHLCDVALPTSPLPPKRHSLSDWYDEYAALYGGLNAVDEAKLADARSRYALAPGTRANGRAHRFHDGRDACIDLLQAGLSLRETADELGVTVWDVVSKFMWVGDTPIDTILEAEELLHARHTYYSVGKRTGLNPRTVNRLAQALGIKSVAAEHQPQGGQFRHTAAEIDRILELRSHGDGYGTIAKKMGTTKSVIQGIVRRNAVAA